MGIGKSALELESQGWAWIEIAEAIVFFIAYPSENPKQILASEKNLISAVDTRFQIGVQTRKVFQKADG